MGALLFPGTSPGHIRKPRNDEGSAAALGRHCAGNCACAGHHRFGVVYVASEHILRRSYEVSTAAVAIATDPAAIVAERRLATVHGCFSDCHG